MPFVSHVREQSSGTLASTHVNVAWKPERVTEPSVVKRTNAVLPVTLDVGKLPDRSPCRVSTGADSIGSTVVSYT